MSNVHLWNDSACLLLGLLKLSYMSVYCGVTNVYFNLLK